MKILLVDDEQLDLFIAKKLLGQEFEVEGFMEIEDASNWASVNSFDVALIDNYLNAGKQAGDAFRAIAAKRDPSTFKAFVLTNHVDDNQAQTLIKLGFAGVILKPVSLEKFKQHIGI